MNPKFHTLSPIALTHKSYSVNPKSQSLIPKTIHSLTLNP